MLTVVTTPETEEIANKGGLPPGKRPRRKNREVAETQETEETENEGEYRILKDNQLWEKQNEPREESGGKQDEPREESGGIDNGEEA